MGQSLQSMALWKYNAAHLYVVILNYLLQLNSPILLKQFALTLQM